MGFDKDCFYCTKGQGLQELMVEICPLKKSTVYLFRDQNFKGRCVVAYNDHFRELFEVTPSELHEYMDDVAKVAEVIKNTLHPDKVSYAVFGDIVSHIHFHLVPKYKDGPLWGEFFCAKPMPVKALPDSEFEELRKLLLENLK